MHNFKEKKGITLIALIITIIILLILAGVSINVIVGDNGVIGQAMKAKEKTDSESAKELAEMAITDYMAKYYTNRPNITLAEFLKEKLRVGQVLDNNYYLKYVSGKVTVFKGDKVDINQRFISGTIEEDGRVDWNNNPLISDVYDESGEEYLSLHVGDYVNYPVYYDNVVDTGNNCSTYNGWRVFEINGDEVKIVSAGCPLLYRYKYGYSVETIKNLTVNFFDPIEIDENSYWLDCKFYSNSNKNEFINLNANSAWENIKNLFNNQFTDKYPVGELSYENDRGPTMDISNNLSTEIPKVRALNYTEANEIAADDSLRTNGGCYFLASAPYTYTMWFINSGGSCSHWYDLDFGIRPVVYLKSDVRYELESIDSDGIGTWILH